MKRVLVTGAAGGMGFETLKQMVEDELREYPKVVSELDIDI